MKEERKERKWYVCVCVCVCVCLCGGEEKELERRDKGEVGRGFAQEDQTGGREEREVPERGSKGGEGGEVSRKSE